LASPYRTLVLCQYRAHSVGVVRQIGFDGVGQEGALLEREGVALSQVFQTLAVRCQLKLAFDLLRSVNVGAARATVVAQVFAQAFDDGPRTHRRLWNISQCRWQGFRQVEHEFAEQNKAPKLGRDR